MWHRTTLAPVMAGFAALTLSVAAAGAQDARDGKAFFQQFQEQVRTLQAAAALDSRVTPEPKQWGGQENTIEIPLSRFVPMPFPTNYAHTPAIVIGPSVVPYYQAAADTGLVMWASVDLPPGAQVTDVCLLAYDNDTDTDGGGPDTDLNVAFFFSAYETGSTGAFSASPLGWLGRPLSAAGTTAAPGFTTVCDTPLAGITFPYLVRGWGNADADADSGYAHYAIAVGPAYSPNLVGFGGAYVKFQRMIANQPAPSPNFSDAGSFPVWAVQAINALYASGITVGCQAPGDPLTYCWSNPVTRAQMAAFFARALGLYWRGDANDP